MIRRHLTTGCIVLLTSLAPICALSTPSEISLATELTPNIENGKKIYPLCAACHMKSGWGKEDGSFPVIAGQHRNVLIKQLSDIRAKNRENPTMFPFTDPESLGGPQAIADVTAYIASLPEDPAPGVGSGKQLGVGKNLYQQSCMHCHGDNGEGDDEAFFPKLKGQHYAYLLRQLKWIRDGYRKNSNPGMVAEVKNMSNEQLDAIADFLSRL